MPAHRRNLVILCLAYALVAVMVLHQLRIDLALSGSDWRQGEWLINSDGMQIRRGLIGSALIRLSDATGIGLLGLAVALPLAVLGLILCALLWFAAQAGPSDRLLLILMSPGFVLFWGADPEGTLRKEVLIYAAFLPLIAVAGAGQGRGTSAALAASVGFVALAAAGHEMTAFFLPALVAAILTCRPPDRASFIAAGAVVVLGVASFGYALRNPIVPDMRLVCDPLLARGLTSAICEGAITWLGRDIGFAQDRLLVQASQPRAWTVGLSYMAALLPFAVALWGRPDRGRWLALLVLAGLPFVPLWFVALDWGRWINAHVAVAAFLVLIAVRRGRLPWLAAPLPPVVLLLTLAICLGVGIRHVGGSMRAGLVEMALRALAPPGL